MWIKPAQTVLIDEGLYTNIARSLAWKGELAYRGQPVDYPYLLYPLLLCPIYWLNRLLGGDVFRWVQVYNTLLITSCVIPAWFFALDFTGDRKKAAAAGIIVCIMPDMVMGAYAMTEALCWLLTFWMIFFCYRWYQRKKLSYGILTALFTGLLFAAKPGSIVSGVVMLVIFSIYTFKKNRPNFTRSVIPLIVLLGVVGVVYCVFLVLYPGNSSILGLYSKQTSNWSSETVSTILLAIPAQIFLFIFACGGIFAIIPLALFGEYEESDRSFVAAVLTGILGILLGTAIFIVPYKQVNASSNLNLHLRYSAMFIPIIFILASKINWTEKRNNKWFIISLSVLAILCLFPGARVGFSDRITTEVDSICLSAFMSNGRFNMKLTGWILTVTVSLFMIYVITGLLTKKAGKNLLRASYAFFVVFLLYNAVFAHINTILEIDQTILTDAEEINSMIGNKDCLGITQRDYYDFYTHWLESRLNQPMQQVTIDQMFVTMREKDGIYSPFVPLDQAPNRNNRETPDTDLFVLGKTIAEHLELNDSVNSVMTKNGHYTFARISPGVRWVDTMMYGLNDDDLYPGGECLIKIYDEGRNIDGNLYLSVTAYGEGLLDVEGQQVVLTNEVKTYEFEFPYKDLIEISAGYSIAHILSYSTMRSF